MSAVGQRWARQIWLDRESRDDWKAWLAEQMTIYQERLEHEHDIVRARWWQGKLQALTEIGDNFEKLVEIFRRAENSESIR